MHLLACQSRKCAHVILFHVHPLFFHSFSLLSMIVFLFQFYFLSGRDFTMRYLFFCLITFDFSGGVPSLALLKMKNLALQRCF